MIRIYFTVLMMLCLIDNVCALPWLHQAYKSLKSPSKDTNTTLVHQINFSGEWVGECDNNPAVDITIKHDGSQLRISYGFMEEHYELGEVKSNASSNMNETKHNTTTVRWSTDYSALIFINTDFFVSPESALNVFFSKVSMTLRDRQLFIKGQYYHTDGNNDDMNQEMISCVYHQK
ncbi:hypothetical protein [Legionella quateirensis]|uniref:Uncharacterized protein n=1 Tax=Legionella quateirensis TaxID=45072 RepID=A0A378KWL4_9GAMM|nr:hypothetical protein [Legionella quateirensis]KTD50857.1 hypothetical protein Lqua_1084 [Legionella quateirensis]STY17897.1 Uncharacterised protein [Legionella quateirensis]